MKSITLRNVPDEFLERARLLATKDRRSLNQALILLLERGLNIEIGRALSESESISTAAQIEIWKNISGKFSDSRSTQKIIADIYKSRTPGREFKL